MAYDPTKDTPWHHVFSRITVFSPLCSCWDSYYSPTPDHRKLSAMIDALYKEVPSLDAALAKATRHELLKIRKPKGDEAAAQDLVVSLVAELMDPITTDFTTVTQTARRIGKYFGGVKVRVPFIGYEKDFNPLSSESAEILEVERLDNKYCQRISTAFFSDKADPATCKRPQYTHNINGSQLSPDCSKT